MSLDAIPLTERELQHEIDHLRANRDVLEKAHGDLARTNERLLSRNRSLEDEVANLKKQLERQKVERAKLTLSAQQTLLGAVQIMSTSIENIFEPHVRKK